MDLATQSVRDPPTPSTSPGLARLGSTCDGSWELSRSLSEFAASVSERALTSAREGLDGLVLPCSYACACTTFGFLAGLGWLGIAGAELDL
jgi:hypothetical protein